MSHKGPIVGFYYSFGYQPQCTSFRLGVDGYYAWSSSIDYNSDTTGQDSNVRYSNLEFRLLGFYPWPIDECWTLEGYSGIGIRSVFNNGYDSVSSTGAVGYDRLSHYNYVPIGARFIKSLDCGYYFIGNVEWDWFLSGQQNSYINGVLKNKQRRGYGARCGVDLYIPSESIYFDYLIGSFLRYWNIRDSEVSTSTRGGFTGYEPRNTTYEIGIRFGLVF